MSRPLRSRRCNERGAAALEAALITPLFMVMVFGIVNLALLMKDEVALTSAVRAGGRTASTFAGAGQGDASSDCGAGCTGSNVPLFAKYAAAAVSKSGTALPKGSINELWIYKANDKGYPGSNGIAEFSTCSSNCVVYKWNDTKGSFTYRSGTWQSSTVNACANSTTPTIDSVGVYLTARHDFNGGLFGTSAMIEDHSMFQFEPLPNGACLGDGKSHS